MSEPLRQLAVLPRPRSHWQAMDAGMLLARAHYWKLLVMWVIFSLPVVAAMCLLLVAGAPLTVAAFLYWWFKPLYELPILMYLSRAVFREPTSIRQAMQESLGHLFRLFRSYLTLSRLSPSRAMTAPVVFLEQQAGKARRQRVGVLTGETTRAYTFMVCWLNVEGIGVYALLGIIFTLMPHDYTMDQIITSFIDKEQNTLGVLITFMYTIGPWLMAGLVAPMYVGGGFLLYLNRRMRLEAWDIEHQFHDLQRKHQPGSAPHKLASHWLPLSLSALLALSLAVLAPAPLANAQNATELPSLTQTRQATEQIYDSNDFGSSRTESRLRFKDSTDSEEPEAPKFDNAMVQAIADIVAFLFSLAKYLIYLVAGAFVALILWRLARYLPDSWQFSGFAARRKPTLDLLDVTHHPLTKSLPSDIAASAREALVEGDNRKALSYLYRGALRTVMRRHDLSVPKSATEGECKRWVAQCKQTGQTKHFNHIVQQWSEAAYANHQPDRVALIALIDYWDTHFSDDHPIDTKGVQRGTLPGDLPRATS